MAKLFLNIQLKINTMKKIMIIDGGPDLQKAFDAGKRMAEKIIG